MNLKITIRDGDYLDKKVAIISDFPLIESEEIEKFLLIIYLKKNKLLKKKVFGAHL